QTPFVVSVLASQTRRMKDGIDNPRDDRRRRDRDEPRERDVGAQSPAHRGELADGADSHHRTGDDVGRAHRQTDQRRGLDHGRNRRRYTMKIKSTAKIAAAKKPSGGEMARLATCLPSDDHLTPPRPPAAAMPEPHRPPMSAWVELLGSPRYQVMRFHEMAPSRA